MTRAILRAAAAGIILCAASALAGAQTREGESAARQGAPATQQPGATADEDFELNITVRRITESDFSAATAVETGGESGLNLKVGVAVRAEQIDVLLRNVRGRVRFRASLEPVLRLLDSRRGAQPATPPPPDTSP